MSARVPIGVQEEYLRVSLWHAFRWLHSRKPQSPLAHFNGDIHLCGVPRFVAQPLRMHVRLCALGGYDRPVMICRLAQGHRFGPVRIARVRRLVAAAGGKVAHTWGGGDSMSFGLTTAMGPAIQYVYDRYRQGCPVHKSPICDCKCSWYLDGHRLLRPPRGWFVLFPQEANG